MSISDPATDGRTGAQDVEAIAVGAGILGTADDKGAVEVWPVSPRSGDRR